MHINTFMFFPAVPESDVDAVSGQQTDYVNTIFEYVNQVILGNPDSTPGDSRGQSHFFHHIVKVQQCVLFHFSIPPARDFSIKTDKVKYAVMHDNIGPELSYEIVTPPPKV